MKKIKKYLILGILLIQMFGSVSAVFAVDPPNQTPADANVSLPPDPGPVQSENSPAAAPTPAPATPAADKSVMKLVPSPDNQQFKVTDYLKAQDQGSTYLTNKTGIAGFIIQVINFLVLTIGSVCFLVILIGGFMYLISHGNETMINKAKEAITYAVIGLVVALSAYFIVAFVQRIFYGL